MKVRIEDFVLSLKLQAEFCGFNNFKEVAVLDRLIAGIKDKNFRQLLVGEEKLTLANAEKIIATWEIARANAGAAEERSRTSCSNSQRFRKFWINTEAVLEFGKAISA